MLYCSVHIFNLKIRTAKGWFSTMWPLDRCFAKGDMSLLPPPHPPKCQEWVSRSCLPPHPGGCLEAASTLGAPLFWLGSVLALQSTQPSPAFLSEGEGWLGSFYKLGTWGSYTGGRLGADRWDDLGFRRERCGLRPDAQPREMWILGLSSNNGSSDKAFHSILSCPGNCQQQVASRKIWRTKGKWKVLWKSMKLSSTKPLLLLCCKLLQSYFWLPAWFILDPTSFLPGYRS